MILILKFTKFIYIFLKEEIFRFFIYYKIILKSLNGFKVPIINQPEKFKIIPYFCKVWLRSSTDRTRVS